MRGINVSFLLFSGGVFTGGGVTACIFTTPRVLSVVTLVWSLAT
jgi:hypothetical protein